MKSSDFSLPLLLLDKTLVNLVVFAGCEGIVRVDEIIYYLNDEELGGSAPS